MQLNVSEHQVRYQILEDGNFNEGKLFKLQQSWILRLQLSNQLIHKKVRVFCNMPIDEKAKFVRTTYYEYAWDSPKDSLKHDEFNRYIEIRCNRPGSFRYYFTYDDSTSISVLKDPTADIRGGSNFLIDPELALDDGRLVNPNQLRIQTCLTKCLGPLNEWKSRLAVSAKSGYNCVHFTPVQALSKVSNSSYSIRDHLKLMDTAAVNSKYDLNEMEKIVQEVHKEWGLFSLCDLVYNHMSNDSEFLRQHPNSSYNMHNSPHLRPAFVFDRVLHHLTIDICRGIYENQGIYADRVESYYIENLRRIIRDQELPKHKIEQFYTIDITKVLNDIRKIGLQELEKIENNLADYKANKSNKRTSSEQKEELWKRLKIVQDPKYRRLMSSIDFDLVLTILKCEFENLNLDLDLKNSNDNSHVLISIYERFQNILYRQNEEIKSRIENDLINGVNNVMSHFHYYFLANEGHKWPKISPEKPVVTNYFYFPFENVNVTSDEAKAYDESENSDGLKIQAYNGWVMGDDPLKNFATEGSNIYFKRELIAWGDCIKLRFGNEPSDSPALWQQMTEYTQQTARIFHGIRLDNCHSTPLHVAQYFLDIAREVRPNLLIIAELFTNSEFLDNKFVSELGITSLVREAMNAWNANELGRLVHRFGGDPVGSFFQPSHRPLLEGVANAILYDLTHDNQSLIKVRSVYDALATGSLVLMSNCSCGSTRGFDELVPHHISVVEETRTYSSWEKEVNLNSGIIKGKMMMNNLHSKMSQDGFSQIYVDQFDGDTTVVTRHNSITHESYILVSRTSFYQPNEHTSTNLHRPLEIPSSRIQSIEFEMYLKKLDPIDYKQSESYINGLQDYKLVINEKLTPDTSNFVGSLEYNENRSLVRFKYFPPGAVIVFKVVLNDNSLNELQLVRNCINQLTSCRIGISQQSQNEIETILNSLTSDELNILLYRCSQEEISEQISSDVYTLPPLNPLIYAGLQGFMNILETERLRNNLGHSIYGNLRDGNWMLEYIANRILKYAQIKPDQRRQLERLSLWLKSLFSSLANLPRYLIPCYFDLILTNLYLKSVDRCLVLMSSAKNENSAIRNFDVLNGSSMVCQLALGSFSLVGYLRESKIPNLLDDGGLILSLSAGLPHFSSTYMRNWGRDTFISLRGLLMLNNRFNDAKNLILAYGACLRHGLIPNLLGEGKFARYNCRDSVWWWLKAIRDYTELAPNGFEILNSPVFRLYPNDDAQYPSEEEIAKKIGSSHIQKLYDVIQEALTVHVKGLKFRERSAGPSIDDRMSWDGFNNEIGVDLNTGFVFGGNKNNAGTWMDKMGSSTKSGNSGQPATPRDGSAVELVGLSRCALDWLITANKASKYPYDGVAINLENVNLSSKKLTWVEWAQKIDTNFEKHFWIDSSSQESNLINKRQIYKDTLNSSLPWSDYQLRPNFLIAMTVAPQMFEPEHARQALEQCRLYLANEPNSIGIKTLDDSDYNYCGDYDNSNDSYDKKVAHGYNYHQGPEWLWPIGFYLRSYLMYFGNDASNRVKALELVEKHLGKLYRSLNSNGWKSLPELTNRNGEECHYSCPSQAWSVACVLEVFYDLANY